MIMLSALQLINIGFIMMFIAILDLYRDLKKAKYDVATMVQYG